MPQKCFRGIGLSRPCHSSSSLLPASHCRDPGSYPWQSMWDLWWIQWHWGRFFYVIQFCHVNIIPLLLYIHSCIIQGLNNGAVSGRSSIHMQPPLLATIKYQQKLVSAIINFLLLISNTNQNFQQCCNRQNEKLKPGITILSFHKSYLLLHCYVFQTHTFPKLVHMDTNSSSR